MLRFAVLVIVVFSLILAVEAHAVTRIPHRCTTRPAERLCAIHFHKDRTNTLRLRMNLHALRYYWIAEGRPARRDRILTTWVHRQSHAKRRLTAYQHSARVSSSLPASWLRAALCVHSHESRDWAANTGNGYTGGMQFATSTWLANGGGRYASAAYLATPNEQLVISYRLWQVSGWAPWPATSAMCGL